jgi:hypothetical protein
MRYFLIFLIAAALAVLSACGKRLTIQEELARIGADRQTLDALLEGSGLTATQLIPVIEGYSGNSKNAFASDGGRLVELRLTGVPLPHLDVVSKMTALRSLRLEDIKMASLPDLSALKGLRTLNIAHNQVKDLTPLAALPALAEVDATGNPEVAIPKPYPTKWKLHLDPNRKDELAAATHPANWVAKTPKRKGAGKNSTLTPSQHDVTGTLEEFDGVTDFNTLTGATINGGATAHVEFSVEQGRVRAYLEYFPGDGFAKTQDGYLFAEAAPGKPARLDGLLAYSTGSGDQQLYSLIFESMEGSARGLRFRITPGK